MDKDIHYKYFHESGDNKVIAVSTYAGKTVRGVAKCAPEDDFNLMAGMELAASRCNLKVARKRLHRAVNKKVEALGKLIEAKAYYSRMCAYYDDSLDAANLALRDLKALEESL